MTISPRLIKRVLSALVIAPVALFLLFYSHLTFLAVLLVFLAVAIYEWACMVRAAPPHHRMIIAGMGLIYLPACFYTFALLRFTTLWESDSLGKTLMLLLMLGVWASDTGGYVVGKLIGGPKLIPVISPNKTWAGFIGALTFPLIVFIPFGLSYEGVQALSPRSLVWFLLASLAVGGAGQLGDLMISSVKRLAGVKDTGTLIPGHGGVLDRIDSLMLASLASFIGLRLMGVFYP